MTQEQADALPTHPLLGRWMACGCGSPSCDRVWPLRMGTFYQGSGFDSAEATALVHALKKTKWRRP
jgi:hypothetical protein